MGCRLSAVSLDAGTAAPTSPERARASVNGILIRYNTPPMSPVSPKPSLAERKYRKAAVKSPLPIAVIPSAAKAIHCDKPGNSAHR